MPVLRGGISLVRYRVLDARALSRDPTLAIPKAFRKHAFVPLDRESGEDERSAGWVELEDSTATRFRPADVFRGDDALASWRIDQVRVPSALLRTQLAEWGADFEIRKGRKPTKREKEERREVETRKLRKRAFVLTKTYDVRWRLEAREVQIWATGQRVGEEIAVALEEGLGLVLRPLGAGFRWEEDGLLVDELAPTAALFGREVSGHER